MLELKDLTANLKNAIRAEIKKVNHDSYSVKLLAKKLHAIRNLHKIIDKIEIKPSKYVNPYTDSITINQNAFRHLLKISYILDGRIYTGSYDREIDTGDCYIYGTNLGIRTSNEESEYISPTSYGLPFADIYKKLKALQH